MISKFLSKIRSLAFWSLDKLMGGKVHQAYRDLEKYDQLDSESKELQAYQKRRLEELINHAISTTDYYSRYKKGQGLEDFSSIDKNLIRANRTGFLSRDFDKSRLIKTYTSGSTGTPFISYMNKEKRKRITGEVLYYTNKTGYNVGDKLIFLRSLNKKTKKTRMLQWLQNENLIDVSYLDKARTEEILREVETRAKKGATLLSYAGTYDVLKKYFDENPSKYEFNIGGMIGISEMLFDETRQTMEEVFGCPCVSRYSNQENGILGQDEELSNYFIINEAHYYIEILDMEEDRPLEPGFQGRVVVTDLYNYAMPLLRYDTGDIGSIDFVYRNGIKKKAITSFSGRVVDMIYDTRSRPISPHKISVSFAGFPGILQYQFIQETRTSYRVKLNTKEDFSSTEELESLIRSLIGQDAEISYEYVDEIPKLRSGKTRYIQSNYQPSQGWDNETDK